jgi:hypothetical protein
MLVPVKEFSHLLYQEISALLHVENATDNSREQELPCQQPGSGINIGDDKNHLS